MRGFALSGLEFGRLIVSLKADADALPGAKAILQGLKKRYERTGRVSTLIHTVSRFPFILWFMVADP